MLFCNLTLNILNGTSWGRGRMHTLHAEDLWHLHVGLGNTPVGKPGMLLSVSVHNTKLERPMASLYEAASYDTRGCLLC